MEYDGALAWSRAGGSGIEGAQRYAARAAELLRGAGPEEWRGTAARAFAQQLSALLADCGRLGSEVEEVAVAVHAVRAELTAAGAGTSLLWRWGAG